MAAEPPDSTDESTAPARVTELSAATGTPMMRQYHRIRKELPADVLLFFRLGDFYELFGEDARTASPILNVTLTRRQETPMCGVPFHAAELYISKLIQAGKRVAICEQKGEVLPGKLVEREVTQVLSAGTVSNVQLLDAGRNHFLAAASFRKGGYGFAYLDLTTGEFRVTELANAPALLDELARVAPAEFLISDDPGQALAFTDFGDTQAYDAHAFGFEQAEFSLREHFRVQSLDGFGCADLPRAVSAAGAILHYLQHQMRRSLGHVTALRSYRADSFLVLDAVSQAHLEVVKARTEGGTSLLQALDRTVTPLGARQLRQWLLYPSRDLATLGARQQAIADLLAGADGLRRAREALREVRDLERLVGRLSQAGGNARDLLALGATLRALPEVKRVMGEVERTVQGAAEPQKNSGQAGTLLPTTANAAADATGRGLIAQLAGRIEPLPELAARLAEALAPEPPVGLKEGGMFRDGYHPELDELRRATREGRDWIAALQEREIESTGIRSLKIRYNSVFGYYIEITKSNLGGVPAHYQRKQTTAGGERFVTPELKATEARILGAEERANQLEGQLFAELRQQVLRDTESLQRTAAALGAFDALAGLAETARQFGYCRPTLREPGVVRIRDGRHPVLDQRLAGEKFVPNDVTLDRGDCRLLVLTGPNMAGKSTFLRQTALLVLLAQTGSFLPAAEAEIGLVDRIFTRVGASDDLSRGQSTFMVEMNETANIIHHATAESLVILDEIGRGTSTYDGLSIAWSVAEHLHDRAGALTLFATHYHELTELAATHPAAKNFTVAVREWNDEIVFLHRIVPGAADRSYGIQVARLAGLPGEVIERAKEILGRLEAGGTKAEVFSAPAARAAVRAGGRRGRKVDEKAMPSFGWFAEGGTEAAAGAVKPEAGE